MIRSIDVYETEDGGLELAHLVDGDLGGSNRLTPDEASALREHFLGFGASPKLWITRDRQEHTPPRCGSFYGDYRVHVVENILARLAPCCRDHCTYTGGAVIPRVDVEALGLSLRPGWAREYALRPTGEYAAHGGEGAP